MLTGRFRRLKHRAAAGPDARWDVWDLDEKDDKILVAIRIDDALPPVCAAIVVRAPSKRNARANEYGLVSINAAGTSWVVERGQYAPELLPMALVLTDATPRLARELRRIAS